MEEVKKHPRIFISYEWSRKEQVLKLAEALKRIGVEVCVDEWNLKAGNDLNHFMTAQITDPQLRKILVVCDRAYQEKADDSSRQTGVGKETALLMQMVLGKPEQEKVIPIVFQKDENGQAYLPKYLQTTSYYDFTVPGTQEAMFRKLARDIYGSPVVNIPELGEKPDWIDDLSRDKGSRKKSPLCFDLVMTPEGETEPRELRTNYSASDYSIEIVNIGSEKKTISSFELYSHEAESRLLTLCLPGEEERIIRPDQKVVYILDEEEADAIRWHCAQRRFDKCDVMIYGMDGSVTWSTLDVALFALQADMPEPLEKMR